DVAAVALEDAGPVREAALGGIPVAGLPRAAVVDADGDDGVGDLLTVGTDVLDRGRPGGAWDSREALQATEAVRDAARDDGVPRLAGGHRAQDVIAIGGVGGPRGAQD